VWTGNISMRRAQYFAIGGFDTTLKRSEDAELGMRLEKDGARFVVTEVGHSIHGSDHASLEGWLGSAYRYGVYDLRIAKKHADLPHANPWRYFDELSIASRPLLAASVAAPRVAKIASRVAMRRAQAAEAAGLESVALAGCTLVYGMEYARGLRDESGGLFAAIRGRGEYAVKAEKAGRTARAVAAAGALADGVRADHATIRRYADKYGGKTTSEENLARDAVQKIGMQMMVAYRVMRFFVEAGVPLAPQIASRMMRHLYGSDIHWKARFDPGVMLVHGMGLAISDRARVAKGAILFQHVTLGMGTHPETRAGGAPTIEEDVHIGPGVTIIGPVTIGARTKIAAGCLVRHDVPPDSLVSMPDPDVATRVAPRANSKARATSSGE
jgi:serine acetyltransferase